MPRKRTLLDAINLANEKGATLDAPVSHDDLRIVFAVLHEMGISQNLDDETFYQEMMEEYPEQYTGKEIMAVQDTLPVGPRRPHDDNPPEWRSEYGKYATPMESIEDVIDRHSLYETVDLLVDICNEKAEHIRVNWQDTRTAKAWERAAKVLERATANNAVRGL